MPETVKLSCACGEVQGSLELHQKDSFHVECLCCDCQQFSAELGNSEMLKSYGGTEILQTYPSYVTITKGQNNISALQLTPKSLWRHYTSCCQTPIGNMMNGKNSPFIGVPICFMQFESDEHKDKILGPTTMRCFAKYGKDNKPADAHDTFPISFMPKIMWFLLKGILTKKSRPSPYPREATTMRKAESIAG